MTTLLFMNSLGLHRLVEGEPRAGWTVGGDKLLDVAGLRELDLAIVGLRDLDVEEIGDGALVLDLPVDHQLLGEGVVDRVLVVVRVERVNRSST